MYIIGEVMLEDVAVPPRDLTSLDVQVPKVLAVRSRSSSYRLWYIASLVPHSCVFVSWIVGGVILPLAPSSLVGSW